jgi:antitoxin CptB
MPYTSTMLDSQVRWKCRRGMKELDVMLARYMDARWAEAGEGERAAFASLLDLQDPELWDILLGRAPAPDPATADFAAPSS